MEEVTYLVKEYRYVKVWNERWLFRRLPREVGNQCCHRIAPLPVRKFITRVDAKLAGMGEFCL